MSQPTSCCGRSEEHAEAVLHSRDHEREGDVDTVRSDPGRQSDAVLLRAEGPAKKVAQEARLGEGLGERLDDDESEDGPWEETAISCQRTYGM